MIHSELWLPPKSDEVDACARNSVPAGLSPKVHAAVMEVLSTAVKVEAAAPGRPESVRVVPKRAYSVSTPVPPSPLTRNWCSVFGLRPANSCRVPGRKPVAVKPASLATSTE